MKYTFRVSIRTGLIFIGLLLVLASTIVCAEVPSTISYQGYLADSSGEPLQGDQLIVFSIYDDSTEGTLIWSEQQTVNVQDGVFNARLGAENALVVTHFDTATLYLEMEIFASGSGWEPFSPRQPLTSTAFAMKAGDADTLEGQGAAGTASETTASPPPSAAVQIDR